MLLSFKFFYSCFLNQSLLLPFLKNNVYVFRYGKLRLIFRNAPFTWYRVPQFAEGKLIYLKLRWVRFCHFSVSVNFVKGTLLFLVHGNVPFTFHLVSTYFYHVVVTPQPTVLDFVVHGCHRETSANELARNLVQSQYYFRLYQHLYSINMQFLQKNRP